MKLDFRKEMQRFLPPRIVAESVNNDRFWDYLAAEISQLMRRVESRLKPEGDAQASGQFLM
ncbi:hypothetical protein D3C78_1898050 [compost metagenome]